MRRKGTNVSVINLQTPLRILSILLQLPALARNIVPKLENSLSLIFCKKLLLNCFCRLRIFLFHFIDHSTGRQKNNNQTLKEKMLDKFKLGNAEELNREINSKMQRMLEETLARNAQLQKVRQYFPFLNFSCYRQL